MSNNEHGRCEVCDSPMGVECSCFCDCGLPQSQCCCGMQPEDFISKSDMEFLENEHGNIMDFTYQGSSKISFMIGGGCGLNGSRLSKEVALSYAEGSIYTEEQKVFLKYYIINKYKEYESKKI